MRWRTYKDYLLGKYGTLIYKVGVDAGFSCPNRVDKRGGCIYCDLSGNIASYQRYKESSFTRKSDYDESVINSGSLLIPSIGNQIKRGVEFVKRRYKADECALYFQSFTNTYAPVDVLERIYFEALGLYDFRILIISTRPDVLGDDVLDMLKRLEKRVDISLEIGLQSASDETLERINRGHGVKEYLDALNRAHQRGFYVSTHVILGLPGETREDYIETAKALNSAKSDGVKIHNLHIPGGTIIQSDYLDGELTAPSMERHLEDTELFLRHLRADTVVERLTSDTPMHRLAAPRDFGDKSSFISLLERRMEENDTMEGDLYES